MRPRLYMVIKLSLTFPLRKERNQEPPVPLTSKCGLGAGRRLFFSQNPSHASLLLGLRMILRRQLSDGRDTCYTNGSRTLDTEGSTELKPGAEGVWEGWSCKWTSLGRARLRRDKRGAGTSLERAGMTLSSRMAIRSARCFQQDSAVTDTCGSV